MPDIVKKLRTADERSFGSLAIICGAGLWVAIAVGVIAALSSGKPQIVAMTVSYLFDAFLFFLFILVSSALYRATAFGNMILLGPGQFPELHAMVVAGSRELGLGEPPRTFLYNSNGMMNAFARRLLGGNYVFLTSALVEVTNDEQVRFIIGHELGHHAAGHLNPWLNFLKAPAHAVPFLMAAYSRGREFTCDRIGAHLSGDVVASTSSLQMLGCGCRRLNDSMSCDAFIAQEAMVPPIAGFFAEIFRSHPRLTRRVAAIRKQMSAPRHEFGTEPAPGPGTGLGGKLDRPVPPSLSQY